MPVVPALKAGGSQVQGFPGLGNLSLHKVTLRFPKEEENRGGEGQGTQRSGGEGRGRKEVGTSSREDPKRNLME